MSCLCAIIEGRSDPAHSISHNNVVDEMSKMGFNRMAAQLALHKLEEKRLILSEVLSGSDSFQGSYQYTIYNLTKDA
jgi:hypothetical protein